MSLTRLALIVYSLILVGLYSITLVSHVLAFLGLYDGLMLGLGLVISTPLLGWLYWSQGQSWRMFLQEADGHHTPAWLERWVGVALGVLVVMVFLSRMVGYPANPLGDAISTDLLGYHGVKAYDLVASGSLWVVDIIYGQYPIGYEALLSVGVLLGFGVGFAGVVQAVTVVWMLLTLFLLLRRYTTLPAWLLAGLVVGMCFLPNVYRFILTIGKNDLLLSLTVLGAILHAPVGWREGDKTWHVIGMAMVTMLSLAIKASALLILVLLWLLVLWRWWGAYRAEGLTGARFFLHPVMFMGALGLMFTGGLWVIRNYVMMGMVFSPEVSGFFVGSIINNLSNPDLYTSGEQSQVFMVLMGLQVAGIGILMLREQWRWHGVIVACMVLAFIIAPLGAFHRPELDTLHIEWRYTAHSFFYMGVLAVAVLGAWLGRVMHRYEGAWWFNGGVALVCGALVIGIMGVLNPLRLNAYRPENTLMLQIGTPILEDAPYHNVYDYVQREIRGATVGYGAGSPLFLYDRSASNRAYAGVKYPLGLANVVEGRVPDYLMQWRSWGDDPFVWQPYFEQFTWELIYSDETGLVWRRVP